MGDKQIADKSKQDGTHFFNQISEFQKYH